MTATPALAPSNGCRLVASDGRALALRSVLVSADAGGGLAAVTLRQVFVNPYPEPLAATYLLPLPPDAAVVDFAFVLGGVRVRGEVRRRADARAAFEQAVVEGRTAALLEQDRSTVFTQELGNLPPGAEVEVEIGVEQLLAWVDGGWTWRWPTVVGPRYLGAPGETPDADRVTVDVLDGPSPVRCATRIAVRDDRTGPVTSVSHGMGVDGGDAIDLAGSLDRDIVVHWPVAPPAAGVRIECTRPAGDADAYALLTVVPPGAPGKPVSRDLCLLFDTSGSMSGRPLDQLKALSTALVDGLVDGDHLEMISFASAPERWKPQQVRIDAATRAAARAWIAALQAGGGTAMHDAVTEALAPLRPEAARQVVLMTDGYIGFEAEVIRRIRKGLPTGSRIHTVGVGSSVNRTLTAGVARAGAGHEAILDLGAPVDAAVRALLAQTGQPLWVGVKVGGTAVREVAPGALPDLLGGAPMRAAVRLDPAGGTVQVTARTAEGTVTHELVVAPVAAGVGRRVVATRFARECVEDLENAAAGGEAGVDARIEALGLQHRIATRMTSWIAATEEATVDPGDPTRKIVIPQALPYGVSAEGVGLAAAAPTGAPTMAMPVRRRMVATEDLAQSGARVVPASPKAEAERESRTGVGFGRFDKAKKAIERLFTPAPAPGAAPPPPPAPMDADDEVLREEQKEVDVEPPAPPPTVAVVKARIVSRTGDRIVVAFTLTTDTPWDPAHPTVAAAGASIAVAPLPGTTRAGRLAAGQTARIVFAWTAASLPERVILPGLHLVIDGDPAGAWIERS